MPIGCDIMITINNGLDLFKAIKSGEKIALSEKVKTFDITNICNEVSVKKLFNDYKYYENVYNGYELHLTGITNMEINGNGDQHIIAKTTYANVITFNKCSDITINNIKFGHKLHGECCGGVLKFVGCKNITIRNCDMYGCGVVGIECIGCESIHIIDSNIYSCSYQIMVLDESKRIIFEGSSFHHNKEFDLICARKSNLTLLDCDICFNSTNKDSSLFSVDPSSVIDIIGGEIHDNDLAYFSNNNKVISLKNVEDYSNTYLQYRDFEKEQNYY